MLHPHILLQEAALQFSKWRATKHRRSDPIPANLQELVIQLSQHYSPGVLIKHLKLSSGFFKKVQQKLAKSKVTEQPIEPQDFISVAVSALAPQLTSCQMTISRTDGCQLVLQTVEPLPIIQVFLCSPSARNPLSGSQPNL